MNTANTFHAAHAFHIHNQVPEQSCSPTSQISPSNQNTHTCGLDSDTITNDAPSPKSTASPEKRFEPDKPNVVDSVPVADDVSEISVAVDCRPELDSFVEIGHPFIEVPGEDLEAATNCLYLAEFCHHVLSRMPYKDFIVLRKILASLLFCFIPLTTATLAGLFSLEGAEEIRNVLQSASSLILVPRGDEEVPVFASSDVLKFFLRHAKYYHVDPVRGHRVILDACTRLMVRASNDERVLESSYMYACRYWLEHLSVVYKGRVRAKL